jgi:thioredoxin-related protein
MRHTAKYSALIISIILIACSATSRAEVHFKDLSFSEAKKLALKEHKKVMIDFFTTWCGWCKVLDKKTYTDDHVSQITDAKFISVKIDAEKGEGIDLAKQYQITGYPTIVFFTPEGKEIDRVVGYEDADHFARSLNIAAGGGSKAIIDELNGAGSNDPQKWLAAADYYAEHGNNDQAIGAFNHVLMLDPDNKQKMKEEAMYGIGFLSDSTAKWTALEQAVSLYPMRDEGSQAVMLLMQHYFETNASPEASRLMDRWAMLHPQDGNTFNYFAWQAAQKGVLLDRAEEYANRAIATMQEPTEKAGAMDTRAEVLYKTNRAKEAAQVEEKAMALVDPSKNAKLYKGLAAQKAKFDSAASLPVQSAEIQTPSATH